MNAKKKLFGGMSLNGHAILVGEITPPLVLRSKTGGVNIDTTCMPVRLFSMQIDFLVRWLPPRIDGVGDYTWNLVCALRKLGIGMRLFTSEEQASKNLAQNEWIFPIIRHWHPRQVVRALKKIIPNKPDWFCFQYVPQMYGRWGICWQVADILRALKNEFRCKAAVTLHEFISERGISLKDIFLASALHLQAKRILSAADLVITTCSRYEDTLRSLAPHPLPVATIPVGSNIEPAVITPEELIERRKEIFPERAKVFGLFGRLCPARNFPFAVRTLQMARQQGLDAWLYLIGRVESSNPKLFKEVMQLADKLGVKSYIATTGELSKEDLSIRLRMVDVFIFPQSDGISTRNTALMAALAFGLPVVSFKPQPGNFDNFHIPCGVLVDRGNERGFIEAAVSYLKESDSLSKAALANSDYYSRHFSWPIIAKEYIKAMEMCKV